MTTSTKKQQRKQFWIRVICIALAIIMVGSLLTALFVS